MSLFNDLLASYKEIATTVEEVKQSVVDSVVETSGLVSDTSDAAASGIQGIARDITEAKESVVRQVKTPLEEIKNDLTK